MSDKQLLRTAGKLQKQEVNSSDLLPQVIAKDDVYISNQLARAQFYTTSVWTGRVFFAICKMIGKNTTELKNEYLLKMSDIKKSPSGRVYSSMKSISKNLINEKVVIDLNYSVPDSADEKEDVEDRGAAFSIFDAVAWGVTSKGEKALVVSIARRMGNFVLKQAKNFTAFRNDNYAELQTVIQQNMYVMLMSYKSLGYKRIYLDELYRNVLHPDDVEKYKAKKEGGFGFGEFNRTILKPSIEAIRQYTGLNVRYELYKEKKNVMAVDFYFDDTQVIDAAKDMIEIQDDM